MSNKSLFFWIISGLSILVITSCKNEKSFVPGDIRPPADYKPYDYRSFWEAQGMQFQYSNFKGHNRKSYKDANSLNFLSVTKVPRGIDTVDLNTRIRIIKLDLGTSTGYKLQYGTKNNAEYYILEYDDSINNKKLYTINTNIRYLKNSLGLTLEFSSFENPGRKQEYLKMVDSLISIGN